MGEPQSTVLRRFPVRAPASRIAARQARARPRGSRRALLAIALSAGALAASGLVSASSAASPAPCPRSPIARVAAERWAPARTTLLPAAPRELRLCRYSGANATPRRVLIDARLLTGRGLIGMLVHDLDALPSVPAGVAFSCPSDDGSEIAVLADYPGSERVTVIVSLTGCTGITNGTVTRTALAYGGSPAGPRLLRELRALTTPTA